MKSLDKTGTFMCFCLFRRNMKIWNKTGTVRVVSVLAGGKFTSPFFICFLGFFRKTGGVTVQYETRQKGGRRWKQIQRCWKIWRNGSALTAVRQSYKMAKAVQGYSVRSPADTPGRTGIRARRIGNPPGLPSARNAGNHFWQAGSMGG